MKKDAWTFQASFLYQSIFLQINHRYQTWYRSSGNSVLKLIVLVCLRIYTFQASEPDSRPPVSFHLQMCHQFQLRMCRYSHWQFRSRYLRGRAFSFKNVSGEDRGRQTLRNPVAVRSPHPLLCISSDRTRVRKFHDRQCQDFLLLQRYKDSHNSHFRKRLRSLHFHQVRSYRLVFHIFNCIEKILNSAFVDEWSNQRFRIQWMSDVNVSVRLLPIWLWTFRKQIHGWSIDE